MLSSSGAGREEEMGKGGGRGGELVDVELARDGSVNVSSTLPQCRISIVNVLCV